MSRQKERTGHSLLDTDHTIKELKVLMHVHLYVFMYVYTASLSLSLSLSPPSPSLPALLFGVYPDSGASRLLSLGRDRKLVSH